MKKICRRHREEYAFYYILASALLRMAVVVPCRENAYSAHWFVFFLCARFRPALIGLYMYMTRVHSIYFHCFPNCFFYFTIVCSCLRIDSCVSQTSPTLSSCLSFTVSSYGAYGTDSCLYTASQPQHQAQK